MTRNPTFIGLILLLAVAGGTGAHAAEPQAGVKTQVSEGKAGSSPAVTTLKSEEMERELEDVRKAVAEIQAASDEIRKEIQLQIEQKFEERKATVKRTYEKAIKDLEVTQRKRRAVAIAKFENFLRKYPNDPKYLPDAIFRLSELYYERVNDDFMAANEDYEKKSTEFREGKTRVEPQRPYRDLEPIIALYKRLVNEFPSYKQIDIVYYLLGFTLWDQGDEKRSRMSENVMDLGELEKMSEPPEFKESKETFTILVTKYPNSRFAPEAWLRIGEYFFNAEEANQPATQEQYLNAALEAYNHAIADNKSPLYDKILYKIAWTYYRKNDLNTAVKYFADLLDFYEKQMQKDKEAKSDLRSDAFRFLAITFSNDTWSGAGVENAKAFFKARGNPQYTKEFIKELGDTLYYEMVGAIIDNRSSFQQAVDAYKYVIALDPYDQKAPELQERIIESYMRSDNLNPEAAAAERQVFINDYGRKSAWYEKNRDNPSAIQAVDGMTDKLLMFAATSHHERAWKLREAGKLDEALRQYQAAAKAYGEYLQMFPHSKNAYDLNFYYADCLYYSFQFADAAVQYEKVRDSTAGNKYYGEAAKSAWMAWAKEIERQIKEGKLAELKLVQGKDRKEGEKIEPKPLADLWKKLITDYDFYLAKFPNAEENPKIAIHSMQIFYAHDDFEEARKRGLAIMKNYPKAPAAKSASELIVETYLAVRDWDKVAEWSDKIQQQGLGDQNFKLEMGKLEAGALFKKAEKLYNDQKYDEAAAEYIRLVNKIPKNEFADRALIMAAKSYEKVRKYDSAAKVYDRIYTEYPQSEFASPSLFLVAQNLEKGFQFTSAIDKYLLLVDRYPDAEQRASALYNAAAVLENIQDYPRAVENFQRFVRTFPDHNVVPDVMYRIILIYEKMKDWNSEVRACEQFQKKYGNDPKQASRVVETFVKVAEAYEHMGNQRLVTKGYEDVLREFQKRNLGPNTRAAYFAAKAKFLQAESLFQKYDALKIGGNPRTMKRELESKAKLNLELKKAYEDVYQYKQTEWNLASLYRIGYAQQRFASALYEAPVPKELKSDEEKEMYRASLEEVAGPIEDRAVELYEIARKTAVELKVVNQWTKKTLESLNKLRPSQYPLQKEPKGSFQESPIRPGNMDMIDKVNFVPSVTAVPASVTPQQQPVGQKEKQPQTNSVQPSSQPSATQGGAQNAQPEKQVDEGK